MLYTAVKSNPVNGWTVRVLPRIESCNVSADAAYGGHGFDPCFCTPPMHLLIWVPPVNTPLFCASDGSRIVWSASSVTSKLLNAAELLM